MTLPAIGEIVHYTSYGTPGGEYAQECRAAVVTHNPGQHMLRQEDGELVTLHHVLGLFVMTPTGTHHNEVPYSDPADKRGGTWHWPHGRTDA